MTPDRLVARRTFLADLGRGAFALAVISSAAACAPAALSSAAASGGSTSGAGPSPSSGAASGGRASSSPPASTPPSVGGAGLRWDRVDLGFVSAYILVRGAEAAIVDTGVAGSADRIEDALVSTSLDWSAVGHVILTHKHSDHIGSAPVIEERATQATFYAGRGDLEAIQLARPVTAIGDGDSVFDLAIVASPGHTPGSISVFDETAGVLVAGDAMGTAGGRPILPSAQFSEDMDQARQSIAKLGNLTFETLLVGHGDPIESGASPAVARLAIAP